MTLIFILIFLSFVFLKALSLYIFLISFSTLVANPGNKVVAPDKIIFPLIFIPIGFTFCFLFNFQIIGMWFGILLMNIFYLIPHSINMYKCYGRFLSN